jgi:hypothetical protein
MYYYPYVLALHKYVTFKARLSKLKFVSNMCNSKYVTKIIKIRFIHEKIQFVTLYIIILDYNFVFYKYLSKNIDFFPSDCVQIFNSI